MTKKQKKIEVPILARVEGEGALTITIKDSQIIKLMLQIFEPPRLFEKFLEGREPNEVVDAVARICGICPVAYQMSAVNAIESCFQLQTTPWIDAMRRLFYCGEWMESHAMHIHMLAAPDFLGYESAIAMAKDHPEIVKRGMHLHRLGNDLMTLLGKRSVHPVGACVGGFYSAPNTAAVNDLCQQFEDALSAAEEMVLWTTNLPSPSAEQDFICVALQDKTQYAMNSGRIISDTGLNIDTSEFEENFHEQQVPYSTALQCLLNGKPYLVGPLARINLNHQQLPDKVKKLMQKTGINWPSKNMFHSITARALEIYFAMTEAITIMHDYTLPEESKIEFTPRAGTGFGCTEAPRGLLWHRYDFTDEGLVKSSRIVPPTSQNQARIEEDLRLGLQAFGLNKAEQELRLHSEMLIRNYDPCISCSTHFLDLRIERN